MAGQCYDCKAMARQLEDNAVSWTNCTSRSSSAVWADCCDSRQIQGCASSAFADEWLSKQPPMGIHYLGSWSAVHPSKKKEKEKAYAVRRDREASDRPWHPAAGFPATKALIGIAVD